MISIIVVVGKNREIGCKNRLLWNLPEDMQRFKKKTTGHIVIMGDKTFESIGKPLPNRENLIITRDSDYKASGCKIIFSLESLVEKYEKSKEEVFVIGGGQIYKQFLPFAKKLYITIINESPNADTFFPDYSDFKNIIKEEKGLDNGHKYTFLELTR